jgi:hypothetical protein
MGYQYLPILFLSALARTILDQLTAECLHESHFTYFSASVITRTSFQTLFSHFCLYAFIEITTFTILSTLRLYCFIDSVCRPSHKFSSPARNTDIPYHTATTPITHQQRPHALYESIDLERTVHITSARDIPLTKSRRLHSDEKK